MSALENWGSDPTEEYQEVMRQGMPGDHYLVALSAREALKCAELMRAALDGNLLAADAARDVVRLLAVLALTVDVEVEDPTVEDLRMRVDDYPWPP
ncbi:MAG: hypothetical protein ACQERF_11855 [Actinomycetota bacterium]